ncbi:MAG: hypothetical protein HRT72_06250 [Flavobacteriales bacterium]|nr:hypothetical protein [Flavobacteriales bacterium]
MKGKIIGIGFEKTGTTTLDIALSKLGYKVLGESPKALLPILKGDYDKVLSIIKDYDALEDKPWFTVYRELDRRIPGSKFILTIRESESWYKSASNHFGDLPSAFHEWIYGRGKGILKDNRDNSIAVYDTHNQGVIEYFKERPTDLLVLDFTKGDKWDKLCAFLERDIPKIPFPHQMSAKTKGSPSVRDKMRVMRRRIKNNFKIKYIDWMGYW